jgi:hypothetical protein
MKLTILTTTLLLLTTACANLGPVFTEQPLSSKSKALVYIYRPSAFTGSARRPDIVINGVKTRAIASGSYFPVEVDPGTSKVLMSNFANEQTNPIDFTTKAGQTYYLRVDLSLPNLKLAYSPGKGFGEKCPFMGLNIATSQNKDEILFFLNNMDTRAQNQTCYTGFLFVKEKLAKEEIAKTQLVVK